MRVVRVGPGPRSDIAAYPTARLSLEGHGCPATASTFEAIAAITDGGCSDSPARGTADRPRLAYCSPLPAPGGGSA